MEIEVVKCHGPILRPGKGGVSRSAVNAVVDALQRGPMTFQDLLRETKLEMAVLADVLRSMAEEDSVAKGVDRSSVFFQLTDEPAKGSENR